MSLRENVVEELRRSPLTLTLTVIGLVIAALASIPAWLPYISQASAPTTSSSVTATPDSLNLRNLSILISFFLASTFSAASLIRLTAHLHSFAAFVLSIPAAVLTSFFSLVILNSVPLKAMNETEYAAAIDSVLYGTVAIFVAVNGLSVLRGLFLDSSPSTSKMNESSSSTNSGTEGVAFLLLSLLLLVIWSNLVSTGLSKLVTAFLTS